MKVYTFLFFVALVFSLKGTAQKKITEGTISYDIVINTGSEKPQNADFLDGATSAVYIKGNRCRTDMISCTRSSAYCRKEVPWPRS